MKVVEMLTGTVGGKQVKEAHSKHIIVIPSRLYHRSCGVCTCPR